MNTRKEIYEGLYTSDLSRIIPPYGNITSTNAMEELGYIINILREKGTCKEFCKQGMIPILHKKGRDCLLTNSKGQLCGITENFDLELWHCCEKCDREGFECNLNEDGCCNLCITEDEDTDAKD